MTESRIASSLANVFRNEQIWPQAILLDVAQSILDSLRTERAKGRVGFVNNIEIPNLQLPSIALYHTPLK